MTWLPLLSTTYLTCSESTGSIRHIDSFFQFLFLSLPILPSSAIGHLVLFLLISFYMPTTVHSLPHPPLLPFTSPTTPPCIYLQLVRAKFVPPNYSRANPLHPEPRYPITGNGIQQCIRNRSCSHYQGPLR